MKKFKLALLALLLVVGLTQVNAQDENNPWVIGIGANAVDFYPVNPNTNWGGNWFNEYFNVEDHYNIQPISKLSVGRYLGSNFSVELAGSLNKIDQMGDMEVDDLSYFALDAAFKYDLNGALGETGWFDPYLSLGGGYVWLEDFNEPSLNGGLGFNIWFTDNLGLNLESKYKHTFDEVNRHFQHSAGLVIKFGGTDTDGDGINDDKDDCPEVFGLKEFNGCPDTDGDGIIDSKDACPEVAGLAELNGCPDSDGDGVADKDDACPEVAGLTELNGCPDADGDGFADKDDACPNVAGTVNGCPDTDGDGVADKDDECVDVAGSAANNGCPEVTDEDMTKIEELFETVYFHFDKATLKPSAEEKLDENVTIMNKYQNTKFFIEGHTDSIGSNAYNLDLSERRAASVKNYLISKGVSASNLESKGYGETQPIDTNDTDAGRAKNRRVEVKLEK